MSRQRLLNIIHLSAWMVAVVAACATFWALWLSRYQPIEWDLAMMHYSAFLINEKGFILYRDIFENNLPGAFLFHVILGKTVGYDAFPLRIVDFCILAGLAVTTWKIVNPISKPGAILASCIFTGLYLFTGSATELQRDYLGILPIAIAVWLVTYERRNIIEKSIFLGALCGLSCGFKPNYIIIFPTLYFLLYQEMRLATPLYKLRSLLWMGVSFTAIFSIPLLWAYQKADYAALIKIYQTFTPIYLQSRTDLYHYSSHHEKVMDLLKNQLTHLKTILTFAMPGLLWAWHQQRKNHHKIRLIKNIGIITFIFSWYELMAGKFWLAHLLPSYYWAIISFSLLMAQPKPSAKNYPIALSVLFILACIWPTNFLLSGSITRLKDAEFTATNDHIQSQKIARYLKEHLQPGDTVQGIDGSGDGQGSLLIARATVATRFLEDIPLYMQPDAPATQEFRREFISALINKPPAYIVYIHNIFHPAGGNRLKEFTSLSEFVQKNYDVAELHEGEYTIYQRKASP